MQCAECKHLNLSTRVTRRWAAVGYAVCGLGVTPAQCGAPTLQSWPIHLEHKCPKADRLEGDERKDRLAKLKFFRDFLEGKRNAAAAGKRRR